MQPFWKYSNKVIVSAYPLPKFYEDLIISKHPQYYRNSWIRAWGVVSNETWASVYMNQSAREYIITLANIKIKLESYISDPNTKRIVTHNNWGEYGHIHHRMVNKAVRDLAVKYHKDVWVLSANITRQSPTSTVDTGSFGLNYVNATFNHTLVVELRNIYRSVIFNNPSFPSNWNTWTWYTGEYDYPYGERMFVRIVNNSTDLTVNNTGIKNQVYNIPVTGTSSNYDLITLEKIS